MKKKDLFKWLDTDGGPILLLFKTNLPLWRGIEEEKKPTDYERACQLEEYINPISIEKSQGIIFGQESMSTTWIKIPKGYLFIRWMAVVNEQTVVEHLNLLKEANFSLENFTFTVESSPIILIDSADSGDDILGETSEIDMDRGTYSIETAEYHPGREIWLFLHRFLKTEK